MVARMPVHLLDPAGSPDGYAPIVSGGKFILDDPSGGVNLRWFVATTYGAVEGGSTTDNRTALNALIADLNTAGEGVFYLDGSFEVDGVLDTITAKANIFGDGAGDLQAQNAASGLKYNATTGYLLTLDNDAIVLEGFGLENPTTTTQTAGAGIRITQGDNIRWRNVSVRGFYDNVTVEDGALWTMRDCYLVGPVRYSLYIRHIDLPDGGDMVVNGCWFYAEDRNASAAVRIESGGGLKFGGNKINTLFGTGHYTYGLDASITATTGVLTLSGNSIENTTSSAIRGQNSGGTFQAVAITGNQFGYYSAITAPAVDINGWKDVTVVGNTGLAQFGGSTQPMVKLTSVTNGAVGLNTMEGFTAEYSLVSCTGVTSGVPTSRLIAAGTGLTGGGDLSADRTISIDTAAELERIQDAVGAMVVAGANVTAVYDDTAGTLTLSSSGGSATALRPLTTESGGVPDFVWDDNNELVMTEAPG